VVSRFARGNTDLVSNRSTSARATRTGLHKDPVSREHHPNSQVSDVTEFPAPTGSRRPRIPAKSRHRVSCTLIARGAERAIVKGIRVTTPPPTSSHRDRPSGKAAGQRPNRVSGTHTPRDRLMTPFTLMPSRNRRSSRRTSFRHPQATRPTRRPHPRIPRRRMTHRVSAPHR
jgi:hypothetical protein